MVQSKSTAAKKAATQKTAEKAVKAVAAKKAAVATKTEIDPELKPASSPVPFAGEACSYIAADGETFNAIVQTMHGGCVADLTVLKPGGNETVDGVPDKSRADGGHYWTAL